MASIDLHLPALLRFAPKSGHSIAGIQSDSARVYDYRADPILEGVLTYWLDARGDAPMPTRAQIDPRRLPRLLPHIQLIDVIEGGRRFRHRLMGTKLAEIIGHDNTGKYYDEILEGERLRSACDVLGAVTANKKPMFIRARYVTTRNTDFIFNRLYMPLSDDGAEVNIILSAITYESRVPANGLLADAQYDPDFTYMEEVELSGTKPAEP